MPPRLPFAIVANAGAAADPALRAAVLRLRAQGHRIEVLPTWEPGDGNRLAREAAARGSRMVFAAGGDGTLHEVANGLLGAGVASRVAIGVLPFGTGNDFASGFGAPRLAPLAALRAALGARPRRIDAIRMGDEYVVNAVTGGFPATLTGEAPKRLKNALGRLAYLISGLQGLHRLSSRMATLTAPDFRWRGRLLGLAIGNGRQAGGGVRFAPSAVLDDGLADILVVPEQPMRTVMAGVGGLIRSQLPTRFRGMLALRAPWIRIVSDRDVRFSLDGEPFSARTARFDVVPGCLLLKAPFSNQPPPRS